MRILYFSDIHFHSTHRFSFITPDGYTVRELEHLSCAAVINELVQKENIDRIVFGGDAYQAVGDALSCQTQVALLDFFDRIRKIVPVDVLVGNHDLNLSSNNNHLAHKLFPLKYFDNITVYDSPKEVDNFVYMPYCTSIDYAESFLEAIESKEDKIVFSHLELKDVSFGGSIITTKGVSLDLLKKFKMTLQGHYHSGGSYASNIYVSGSTQRLSFKDPGLSHKNILIYDTETNKIKRESFNCPDWYEFTDENIEDILKIPDNSYVKVRVSLDFVLTSEIKKKLQRVKDKDIKIEVNRINFDGNIETPEDIANKDELTVIKYFIDKSDNSEEDKKLLLEEGNRLIESNR